MPGEAGEKEPLGTEMVEIPAGKFKMGSIGAEKLGKSDERQHEVVLSRPFLAARYEVTQRLWKEVMGSDPSHRKELGDNCPVGGVSWFDAVVFCNQLSEREDLDPAYRIKGKDVTWDRNAKGYRLPTEAEWEYACRAGTTTWYYTGDSKEILDGAAWYNGSVGAIKQQPVGLKAPNPWGLYDMHGNVFEWCWDWYDRDYPKATVIDPAGPSCGPLWDNAEGEVCSKRVTRGGGWSAEDRSCRSACRGGHNPLSRIQFNGLRLFRSR